MEWSDFLTGILTTPIVFGLSAWMGKVWANRILEKDRAKYQSELQTLLADLRVKADKELLVHRLQFEREFAIYQELWHEARILALACQGFDDLQQGPLKPQQELVAELCSAHDAFLETVRSNEPFYAIAVYEAAEALRQLVVKLHFSERRLRRIEGAKQSENNVEKLIKLDEAKSELIALIPQALPRLREAIRNRIWSTRTTGWDRSQ